MNAMGRIFYLMGKSASGKDTIYKRLLAECPDLRRIILYTTRPMRAGESEGVEYHFVTAEALADFAARGKVIEQRTYQTVAGPWSYATVDDGQVALEENNYLVIGTLESYEKLRQYFGAEHVVPLYVAVEDGLRLSRALERERGQQKPNYAELCRRFLADEADFSEENLARCGIETAFANDSLEDCVAKMKEKIREAEAE